MHGAIFGIAGILIGLFRSNNLKNSFNALPEKDLILKSITNNNILFKDHRVKGFAMIFKALCQLIRAICESKALLDDSQVYFIMIRFY